MQDSLKYLGDLGVFLCALGEHVEGAFGTLAHVADAGAINAAEKDGTELADVLIAALGQKAGCSVTLTFDKEAARLPGFELAR
jgi:predicted nucleic acid-binding protein